MGSVGQRAARNSPVWHKAGLVPCWLLCRCCGHGWHPCWPKDSTAGCPGPAREPSPCQQHRKVHSSLWDWFTGTLSKKHVHYGDGHCWHIFMFKNLQNSGLRGKLRLSCLWAAWTWPANMKKSWARWLWLSADREGECAQGKAQKWRFFTWFLKCFLHG